MTPQSIAGLINGIVPSLEIAAGAIAASADLRPETLARIRTALDGVRDGAGALAQSESLAAGLPILDRVVTDANAVLATAMTIPLPPQAAVGVRIAAMLVPMLGAIANVVASQLQQPQAATT